MNEGPPPRFVNGEVVVVVVLMSNMSSRGDVCGQQQQQRDHHHYSNMEVWIYSRSHRWYRKEGGKHTIDAMHLRVLVRSADEVRVDGDERSARISKTSQQEGRKMTLSAHFRRQYDSCDLITFTYSLTGIPRGFATHTNTQIHRDRDRF